LTTAEAIAALEGMADAFRRENRLFVADMKAAGRHQASIAAVKAVVDTYEEGAAELLRRLRVAGATDDRDAVDDLALEFADMWMDLSATVQEAAQDIGDEPPPMAPEGRGRCG
jgi:hypothetical protein